MKKRILIGVLAFGAILTGSGLGMAWAILPSTHSEPANVRDVYADANTEPEQTVHSIANVAMDIIEGVDTEYLDSQLQFIIDCATDEAYDISLRRWSVAAIGDVFIHTELDDEHKGILAQALLDIANETYGSSDPGLLFATRKQILSTGLIQYGEFVEAVARIEDDVRVIAYLLENGIEPSWLGGDQGEDNDD